jgi:hypothetical protein
MADANEYRKSIYKDGSATCLARVLDVDGQPITVASIESATYTIALIDPMDEDGDTPVVNHADVALTPADIIFDTLQKDAAWSTDADGYNFRHTIDVSEHAAFTHRGKEYRVTYKLIPDEGQVIILRFRLKAI